MWVIQRNDDGAYVAMTGSRGSYVRCLQDARTFSSKEAAERECCGNERVVTVESQLRRPD